MGIYFKVQILRGLLVLPFYGREKSILLPIQLILWHNKVLKNYLLSCDMKQLPQLGTNNLMNYFYIL